MAACGGLVEAVERAIVYDELGAAGGGSLSPLAFGTIPGENDYFYYPVTLASNYATLGFAPINTPEALAAFVAQHAERKAATDRAEALLRDRLGPKGHRLFQRTRTLTRPSRRWPEMEYVIRRGERVKVVQRGRVYTELCVLSANGEPEADRLMSILDLIETDEMQLWAMANTFPQSGELLEAPRAEPPSAGCLNFLVGLFMVVFAIGMAVLIETPAIAAYFFP